MARDIIHNTVRLALENENWIITDDPFNVKIEGGSGIEIDLGAEKFIAAEKENQKIAVEIKTFANASIINTFHQALGQYLDYRDALEEGEIARELFLAISVEVNNRIENFPFIMRRIEKYGLKIIVVDINSQTIVKWKK
jgi:hypothetical protein